jgi:hypothetical protein
MDAHNEVMRKTRDMRNYATLFKVTEDALRSKEDDPCRRLRFSLCITLHGTHRKHWNVRASGSLKGVKASYLMRACEATHENVDSPMEFHRGQDDRSEAPFQMRHRRKRRRPHERGREHLYERQDGHRSRLSRLKY